MHRKKKAKAFFFHRRTMKIPISERLLCCASLVPAGARVADIGCDHGYLGIWLLAQEKAEYVCACDLREKPLEKARDNARIYATEDRMRFFVADGLASVDPKTVDTIVCAGMGGDNIAGILQAAPWVRDPGYTLILQPQTSGNDLRRYLGEQGFAIEKETLVRDGGFLYFTLVARFGGGQPLSPGQQYLSPELLSCDSPLLPDYFDRVIHALEKTVEGIGRSERPDNQGKLKYYSQALEELREMRQQYDRTGNS